MMDSDDRDLIVLLASSSASLATAPGNKDNWVERAGPGGQGGELPRYVRKIARGIMKSGKSKSQAIAIAISRIKRWARGGEDVKADTRIKAAKALAEWTALKAKNKRNQIVKASNSEGEYFMLSYSGEFNTDLVRRAWNKFQSDLSKKTFSGDTPEEDIPVFWIVELWTSHIIVEKSTYGEYDQSEHFKIPYTVEGSQVNFGVPEPVKSAYVPVESDLTSNEKILLSDLLTSSKE
jgi:hypothetical protein